LAFGLLQFDDFLFDGAARDEAVGEGAPGLAAPVFAVLTGLASARIT